MYRPWLHWKYFLAKCEGNFPLKKRKNKKEIERIKKKKNLKKLQTNKRNFDSLVQVSTAQYEEELSMLVHSERQKRSG